MWTGIHPAAALIPKSMGWPSPPLHTFQSQRLKTWNSQVFQQEVRHSLLPPPSFNALLFPTYSICSIPAEKYPNKLANVITDIINTWLLQCDPICSIWSKMTSHSAWTPPHHFVFRSNRSTEDVFSMALHSVFTLHENNNTCIRRLFVDFSSAFSIRSTTQLIGSPTGETPGGTGRPVSLQTLVSWISHHNKNSYEPPPARHQYNKSAECWSSEAVLGSFESQRTRHGHLHPGRERSDVISAEWGGQTQLGHHLYIMYNNSERDVWAALMPYRQTVKQHLCIWIHLYLSSPTLEYITYLPSASSHKIHRSEHWLLLWET